MKKKYSEPMLESLAFQPEENIGNGISNVNNDLTNDGQFGEYGN